MMNTRSRYGGVVLAAALLLLGTAGLALAGEEMKEPAALTGCLLETEEGGYALDEFEAEGDEAVEGEDSGEIALEGEGLDEHVGHTVTVTGEWADDGEGGKSFKVASLEHVAASCEA